MILAHGAAVGGSGEERYVESRGVEPRDEGLAAEEVEKAATVARTLLLLDEANARERALLDRPAHEHAGLELPLADGLRRFAAEQRLVRCVGH